MKTILVCGNAETLHEDHSKARALFPTAEVLAVNKAGAFIVADYLFTLHPKKAAKWHDRACILAGREIPLIASGKENMRLKEQYPWVDVWVDGCAGNGTSGWGARKYAAQHLGADLVVLCGVPLSKMGKNKELTGAWAHESVVDVYREYVRNDTTNHAGVKSMSGWTREFFGAP